MEMSINLCKWVEDYRDIVGGGQRPRNVALTVVLKETVSEYVKRKLSKLMIYNEKCLFGIIYTKSIHIYLINVDYMRSYSLVVPSAGNHCKYLKEVYLDISCSKSSPYTILDDIFAFYQASFRSKVSLFLYIYY